MKPLDANRVAIVADYLTRKRREKFLASVDVINTSVAQGAWVKRGSVKADAGFYQGIIAGEVRKHVYRDWRGERFALSMCLCFGKPLTAACDLDAVFQSVEPRPPIHAWVELCNERAAVCKALDAARPLPTITPIGLSPKVTKTLTECNLDLELSSIVLAKIAYYERPEIALTRDGATLCVLLPNLQPRLERVYYPDWTPGIKHGLSRCAGKGDACEACGKYIPSLRFVALEATCKRHGRVSLWVGRDCAANIFGVVDVGVSRAAETAQKGI